MSDSRACVEYCALVVGTDLVIMRTLTVNSNTVRQSPSFAVHAVGAYSSYYWSLSPKPRTSHAARVETNLLLQGDAFMLPSAYQPENKLLPLPYELLTRGKPTLPDYTMFFCSFLFLFLFVLIMEQYCYSIIHDSSSYTFLVYAI